MDLIESWGRGAQTLALLHTAVRSGLLERMPLVPDSPLLTDVCQSLAAAGVLSVSGERYSLEPAFAEALDPAGMMPLPGVLEGLAARVQALQESQGYPEAALGVAMGATFNPNSAVTHSVLSSWLASYAPELAERWAAGARHCEFGCGLGGGLFWILLNHPQVVGVGIERDLEVCEAARSLAARLGLTVDLRCADVCALTEEAEYDTGFWSQSFFPSETRSTALSAIARALKPGGLLLVPGFEGGEPSADLGYQLSKLVYRTWGVPAQSLSSLSSELSSAGFTVMRSGPLGPGQTCILCSKS